MVHHRAVGDEGQRAGQVRVAELVCVSGPKKYSAQGQAKNSMDMEWTSQASSEGHWHSPGTMIAAGEVGEGVAGLVRDDLDVVLRCR